MSKRNYRRLTPGEKRFLKRYGHRIRIRDLAKIMNLSFHAAERMKSRYCHRSKGSRISLTTAKLNLQRCLWRLPGYPDLVMRTQPQPMSADRWEDWQLAHLRCTIGKEPLAFIGKHLGKSRWAVYRKAREIGLHLSDHRIGRIARRLKVLQADVVRWISPGSGDGTGFKVRWYRDGRYKIIHRDDAEWLLANPQKARAGCFPDHPGKLSMEFELDVGINDDQHRDRNDNHQ